MRPASFRWLATRISIVPLSASISNVASWTFSFPGPPAKPHYCSLESRERFLWKSQISAEGSSKHPRLTLGEYHNPSPIFPVYPRRMLSNVKRVHYAFDLLPIPLKQKGSDYIASERRQTHDFGCSWIASAKYKAKTAQTVDRRSMRALAGASKSENSPWSVQSKKEHYRRESKHGRYFCTLAHKESLPSSTNAHLCIPASCNRESDITTSTPIGGFFDLDAQTNGCWV